MQAGGEREDTMEYTISNGTLTLTVSTYGAEAVSLKNAAGQEMLWQADPAIWPRHAPILFPWTGKLTGGSFFWKGREYAGGQHGFARDLEHRLISRASRSITLELTDGPETEARFPFRFALRSTFRLEGSTVHHTLEVENRDSDPMPFGIGYHPGFAVPFDEQHTTEDYEFRFDTPQSPLCIDCLPHGLVNGTCYYLAANTDRIPLTDRLFDNDSFCMANLTAKTLGIVEKDTGRNITCRIEGYPYALIWSAHSEKIRFVCIEPWHSLPGTETGSQQWADRPAAAILAPGQSWSTCLTTNFER